MVIRNGKKGFLDDKGNFYPIADLDNDDAKVSPSSAADQSGGLGNIPSSNANRDGSRPGGGMTDAQIKAAQDKVNADRKSDSQPIPRGLGLGAKSGQSVLSIPVEPYKQPKNTGSFFDGARGGKYDTPDTYTPQQRAYGDYSKLSQAQQDANLEYDKKRYELDAKGNPIIGKFKADQTDAKEFGLKANAANFPNQRIFIDPNTGKRVSRFSGFTNKSSNPTKAATGGTNPRAGSYAAYQQNVLKNLGSDYGRLPQNTIKPVVKRTMKKEAYDVVLDYLLSEGHVDTVEEAHYVMLQMTSEHVQEVVEGKYADSVTYVKGTAPVRASYGGKPESFTKETYKKKGKV